MPRPHTYVMLNRTVQHRMLDMCEIIIKHGHTEHVTGAAIAIKQLLLSKTARKGVGPRYTGDLKDA